VARGRECQVCRSASGFESFSAHHSAGGERGQGDEGDPKTGDSRRAAGRRTKRPAQPAQPGAARLVSCSLRRMEPPGAAVGAE
jgi:hypothetical protein